MNSEARGKLEGCARGGNDVGGGSGSSDED